MSLVWRYEVGGYNPRFALADDFPYFTGYDQHMPETKSARLLLFCLIGSNNKQTNNNNNNTHKNTHQLQCVCAVSYTHLTLPTRR